MLLCNPHNSSRGSEWEGILPDDPLSVVSCGVQGKAEKKSVSDVVMTECVPFISQCQTRSSMLNGTML